jgi:hypothetical protein
MTLAVVPREPTDTMVTEVEMRMPQLGRLQIRMLYKLMVAAAPFPDSQMIMLEAPLSQETK